VARLGRSRHYVLTLEGADGIIELELQMEI